MIYQFPDHKKGDTFGEVSFTITSKSPTTLVVAPIDLTGALVRIQFKKDKRSQCPALELNSLAGGGITITTPLEGKFRIDKRVIDIEAGTYEYDVEITLANGEVHTYVEGTLTILQDVTR